MLTVQLCNVKTKKHFERPIPGEDISAAGNERVAASVFGKGWEARRISRRGAGATPGTSVPRRFVKAHEGSVGVSTETR